VIGSLSILRGFGVLVNQIVEAPRMHYGLGGYRIIRAKSLKPLIHQT